MDTTARKITVSIKAGGATHTWTVDTTAPTVTLTATPPATSPSADASFSFAGSDGSGSGVARFEVSLNGSSFAAGGSPQHYIGLAEGSHTFRVRAVDLAGNATSTPAAYTWTVDTTSPTDLNLSSLNVPENRPASTVVGTLTPSAPSGGQSFSYALVPDPGSADNGSFRLVGNEVRTVAVFNAASQSSYAPRVRVQNGLNQSLEKAFTITVLSNPLPVKLTGFTAAQQGRAVGLRWATASEKNSARFEVERSPDGRAFRKIGEVAAAGSSTAPRPYAFADASLPAGTATLYYRLRQVDLDGTASYSPVRVVPVPALAAPALHPSPTTGTTTLAGAAPGAAVQVQDAVGRTVATAVAGADGRVQIDRVTGQATGLYVVRVAQCPCACT